MESTGENRFISNSQQEQVKEILVRDNPKAVVYKYRLGEKVWKRRNCDKHEGFVYGMYEIDKVFYLVFCNRIVNWSQQKVLNGFPSDLILKTTCQIKKQILFFSISDPVKSRLFDTKSKVWRNSSAKHPRHSFAVEYQDKVWMIGG